MIEQKESKENGGKEEQKENGEAEKPAILINNKQFRILKPAMTGREIKDLGRGSSEYLLVLVVGEPDEVAGGDDEIIGDDKVVDLKPGMRFRIVNPATFG